MSMFKDGFARLGGPHLPQAGWLGGGVESERPSHWPLPAGAGHTTRKGTAVPTDVPSAKSMKLSYLTLLRSFSVLSPANPPPSPRRGVPGHVSHLL